MFNSSTEVIYRFLPLNIDLSEPERVGTTVKPTRTLSYPRRTLDKTETCSE
jgi:hypothetical protein